MGDHGAKLIPNNATVMTVCNAGALATVDYGTALGVFYSAQKKGKKFKVYACETRPLLQGARLTAWELLRAKIDTTLICDNMAATLMKQSKVSKVIVGADRIAANGDTANKIGTYEKAVLAKENEIPFYVAAPTTTFDLNCESGSKIPIEERSEDELHYIHGIDENNELKKVRIAPKESAARNPAFDVTPARYITGIINEKGVIKPINEEIRKFLMLWIRLTGVPFLLWIDGRYAH